MRNIPLPNDEHLEAFNACIGNFQNAGLIQSYEDARDHVMIAGNEFLNRIQINQLSSILPTTLINGVEMQEKMKKLYTEKLVKKGQPGRVYYDKWRALAPNGRCPLCGVKQVSTLDHYLSKSAFPVFAVFPFNLIPACRDCNTEKLAHIAQSYAEETLHPYFDNIDQKQWLYADIIHTDPVAFNFRVVSIPGWTTDMTDRVNKHMEVFKLYDLFGSHAGEELTNITFQLRKLFQVGGPIAVRAHLFDCMESSMHAHVNSWRTATYQAMFNDMWFHSNGY